jgi:hypothetical protein
VAITTPVDTTVTVSEEVTLPQDVTNALPQVECVLDVVLDGIPFDETNSDSFWAILARYLSRQNESDEDGYFTVSPSQVSAAAKALFSGIETIPDCPENSDLAQSLDSGDYRLHWGVTGGHSLEVIDYDGDLVIEADGTTRYTVEVDGNGAVLSVGES